MSVIVHSVHNNIVPHIATPCCLFCCDCQPWLTLLCPQPAQTPAPKGKHVQLFKMRQKVGKGFYSTAPDAPDGEYGQAIFRKLLVRCTMLCKV